MYVRSCSHIRLLPVLYDSCSYIYTHDKALIDCVLVCSFPDFGGSSTCGMIVA